MKKINYDQEAIEKLAAQLNSKARSIIISSQLLYLLIIGGAGFSYSFVTVGMSPTIPTLTGVILGVIAGTSSGKSKALVIRAQAATLLCALTTEINTRAGNGKTE